MEEKKKKHITLINILVLVAILALILAIIIPVHKPHPRPRRVICMSNLKQLSIALLMYQVDKQMLPGQESWCDLMKSYSVHDDIESIMESYLCPFDKTGPCSYALNENIPADANELPGDLVLLFESAPGWNRVGGPDDVVTDRHGKNNPGANIAFADGHIKFVNAEDIPHLRWTVD